MPCAVAGPVPSSPMFLSSPRASPIFHCQSPTGYDQQSTPSTSVTAPSTSSSSLLLTPPAPVPKRSCEVNEAREESHSGTVLKRKRPAMINIPVSNGSLGFEVERDRGEEKRVEVVEIEKNEYSVYCKRGRRGVMEDRFSALVNGDRKQALFGVFDGHGGSKAAEYAAKNLEKNIMAEVSSNEGIEMAVRNGYLTTDREFLKENLAGGTCSVTALIHEGNLVVSNAGDCRAVMSRGGVAEALTSDHQPSRIDEKNRIEALGGYVDCCNGVWRIQGSLAVTRAIGDGHLKKWVTAEPETKILKLGPECEFLIFASDGLWDKVNNQEAVDIARTLCFGVDKPQLLSACKKLTELSFSRGSLDDISVMIILLHCFIP